MPKLLTTLRNDRFVALAILAAAFAQLAMTTHEMLVEHSLGQQCEICVAQGHSDDLLVSIVVIPTPVAIASSDSVAATQPLASIAATAIRNRGPPVL